MKILRITLNNIASLAGQHTVDFTQEPLRSAGLYAISGDTGSGKSSLLDAMCLALYGKTPRLKDSKTSLEKINNDEKQLDPRSLLRRGTAEGMAEVAFVGVDGKPWTARWSVRRARKSVSGKLQQVDRTLFQGHIEPASDGTIESGGKKTEVESAIQKKLGLTFDQFTRAVLLAQNEFAVFLQSDDKARAEILQALTGTGRFEEISRAVFERCKIERKQIDDLKSRLTGGTVLSDEDRAEKGEQLSAITAQLAALQSEQKQLEAEHEWHRSLEKHTAAMTAVQAELAAAQKQLADSQPRKQRLRHTEHVLRHTAPLKQAVSNAEAQLKESQADLKSVTESVAGLEQASKKMTADVVAAERCFESCKGAVERLQPQLILAARLEESISLQSETAGKANQVSTEAVQQHREVSKRLEQISATLKAAEMERGQLHEQQQHLHRYKPFVARADTWVDRLDQVTETREKSNETISQLRANNEKLSLLRNQKNEADEAWRKLLDQVESSQEQLNQLEKAAEQFDRSELSEQRDFQQLRRDIWAGLKAFLVDVQENETQLNECQLKLSECVSEIQRQGSERLQLVETDIPAAELAVQNQEAALSVVQAAISDEAIRLRTQLAEDQPCSVCGSTHHPYSAEPPSADQTAVKALQQILCAAQSTLQELKQRASALEAEQRANETRQREYQSLCEKLTSERSSLLFEHADHPEVVSLRELPTQQQLAESETQLQRIHNVVQELRHQEKRAAEADQSVTAARKDLREIQSQERIAKEQLATFQQSVGTTETDNKHLVQRDKELRTELENQLLQLQELFAAIPNSQDRFEADAVAFRDHFRTTIGQVGDVEKRLAETNATIKQSDDQMATVRPLAEVALKRKLTAEEEAIAAQKHLTDLNQQKQNLFEGRSAETVKQECDQQLVLAEQQRKTIQDSRDEFEKQFAAAKQKLEQAGKQDQTAQQKVAEAKQKLAKWREEFNTSNNVQLSEEELNQMLNRGDDWLKSESEELDQLAATVQTRTGQLETLQTQQQELQSRRPSEKTWKEVAERMVGVTEKIKAVQQEKEDLQKELNVDDAQRDKNKSLQEQLTKQEAVATPWMRLNEVIGSSDGSSFRNIAQRHTLDILLRFANHQLRLLSGRYRLERIPNSLNLMVVDQEMADERRSIHSLSGGESFLVSLALALGLASLTSNRLKIESLFIDEGFGSLDPNTLDLAMNALMQLESQGRKVGVISHVTTMTDAIPVQIKVAKGSSGASTIQVPVNANIRKHRPTSRSIPTIQPSLFPED